MRHDRRPVTARVSKGEIGISDCGCSCHPACSCSLRCSCSATANLSHRSNHRETSRCIRNKTYLNLFRDHSTNPATSPAAVLPLGEVTILRTYKGTYYPAMPSTSQSPRRKRVRRYFSASAATGARYAAKLNAHSVGTARRRRGSSSSSRGFRFSPEGASDDSGVEDVHSYHHSDNEHAFRQESSDIDRGRTPLAYASLPPTPISSSPPLQTSPPAFSPSMPSYPSTDFYYEPPFSIWDYLREELLATDFDSHQELKWERVSNFLNMPLALEKVSSHSTWSCVEDQSYILQIFAFGFIVCLDSFLYTFTILPIRFALAVWRLILNTVTLSEKPLPPSQKADILRTLLLIVSVIILSPLTDASKIYHSIRGQDTIKLYVIFNALEVRRFSGLSCLQLYNCLTMSCRSRIDCAHP